MPPQSSGQTCSFSTPKKKQKIKNLTDLFCKSQIEIFRYIVYNSYSTIKKPLLKRSDIFRCYLNFISDTINLVSIYNPRCKPKKLALLIELTKCKNLKSIKFKCNNTSDYRKVLAESLDHDI